MIYEKLGFSPYYSVVEEHVPASRLYAPLFKRGFDVGFVLVLCIVFAPILAVFFAVVLTLVSLDGRAPIYRQCRVGRNGRKFRMLKVRTMVPQSDAALTRYLAENPSARAEWEVKQKLVNDPRVTRFGRFLRRSSLDELPQLWNVLRGDMSLVGPRPIMVDQVGLYPGRAYFSMRPGLTGLWQISARHRTSFAERAEYDDSYYTKMSFGADMMILLRTVRVILRGTGC